MGYADDERRDQSQAAGSSLIRWRPWPCESCSGGSTALDYLGRSPGSGEEVRDLDRNEQIDRRKIIEARRLREWVEQCPHTKWCDLILPDLAEGSEHLVFFDEQTREVVKLTRPGIYGDYYEIVNDRVAQFDNTPREYLLRMRWWEILLSTAPDPRGLTETGQILSRQTHIRGDLPTQGAVDDFLASAGLSPVKKNCWLWKKADPESRMETWIGDARSDNFVSVGGEIVPIDIRVWRRPVSEV
jgi:hypothetical protein